MNFESIFSWSCWTFTLRRRDSSWALSFILWIINVKRIDILHIILDFHKNSMMDIDFIRLYNPSQVRVSLHQFLDLFVCVFPIPPDLSGWHSPRQKEETQVFVDVSIDRKEAEEKAPIFPTKKTHRPAEFFLCLWGNQHFYINFALIIQNVRKSRSKRKSSSS